MYPDALDAREAPYVVAATDSVEKTAARELTLLLALLDAAAASSPLLCAPCREGLCLRYLAASLHPDLTAAVERRLAAVLLDPGPRNRLARAYFAYARLAAEGRGPRLRDDAGGRRSGARARAAWLVSGVGAERGVQLCAWLDVLDRVEDQGQGRQQQEDVAGRAGAWRARAWIAAAGRYTLADLRRGRSVARFLEAHERRVLECCRRGWRPPAAAPVAAPAPEPDARGVGHGRAGTVTCECECECFRVRGGGAVRMFSPATVTGAPGRGAGTGGDECDGEEHGDTASVVYARRCDVLSWLFARSGFDPEILDVFHRLAPPFPVPREGVDGAPVYVDPFETFEAYWHSTEIQQMLKELVRTCVE